MRSFLLPLSLLSLTFACTGTSAEDPNDPATQSSSDETGSDGEETTGTEAKGYAHGMSAARIVINQGVEVPVWTDGAQVDTPTPLITSRKTLMRVIPQVAPDWQEREIRGLLHVINDGEDTIGEQVVHVVAGEPGLTNGDELFDWVLPADFITADTELYVEFFEHDAAYLDQEDPETAPRYPTQGTLQVFEELDTSIKLVLVPLIDTEGECVSEPEITDEMVEALRLRVLEINPVSTVEVEVRDPVHATSPLGDGLGAPLEGLEQMRADEGATNGELYYGVARACSGHNGSTQCIRGDLGSQVAVIRAYDTAEQTASRIDYCMQGSLGLWPVDCPNDGGNVPVNHDYPYEDGLIGSWGWSVVDHSLKRPDLYYSSSTWCMPKWVSDYEWTQLASFLSAP